MYHSALKSNDIFKTSLYYQAQKLEIWCYIKNISQNTYISLSKANEKKKSLQIYIHFSYLLSSVHQMLILMVGQRGELGRQCHLEVFC